WLCALPTFENLLVGSMQHKREYTAAARIVFNPDVASMRLHDCLTDCQTQTDTLARDLLTVLYLVEFAKDLFLVILRNSRAGIRNRDSDVVIGIRRHASDDLAFA